MAGSNGKRLAGAARHTAPRRQDEACEHSAAILACVVAEAGYDREERRILTALRHFFSTFTEPHQQGWSRALQTCFDGFPENEAANIWLALLGVVQSLRMVRTAGFTFSNPDCRNCSQALTPEERQLMGVIAATRRGQRGQAQTHALVLCEGGEIGPVLGAAGHLGRTVARALANDGAGGIRLPDATG